MDLDIRMLTRFMKSTQWIYPIFTFIAHVHRGKRQSSFY